MTIGQYVTLTGLQIPTVQGLVDEVSNDLKAAIDPNLDTGPESPVGQINGVMCSHLRVAWEGVQVAYNADDPDAAEGERLDAVCAITGTNRAAPTPSSFLGPRRLKINLNAATTVNAGTLFSVAGSPQTVFATTENVVSTIAGVYYVPALCTRTGPVACNAGTLTVIQTPVSGLNSVTNDFDAVIGTDIELDPDLRIRRVQELNVAGAGSTAAITSALLAYTTSEETKPILDAITYENTGDTFDAAGRPPHSIESVVYDGDVPAVDNDVIAQVIWENRDAGIQTFGNQSGQAVDELGILRTVYFSRPTIQPVKVSVTAVYDVAKTPPSALEIKAVLKATHDAQSKLGKSLLRWNIFDAAVQDNVTSALGCTSVQLGYVGGLFLLTFTNLTIAARTKTTLDTSDITVAIVAGTP